MNRLNPPGPLAADTRALTAKVTYQPPQPFAREVYHAVPGQAVTVGFITRPAGQPLCGSTAPLGECPPGLFPPTLTCTACRAICAHEGIIVDGAQ